MDTSSLSLFLDVAKSGSFAAVARKRDLDPSNVSRTITALEDELKLRLLQRSTRKLALTEAGERYLSRIAPLLSELSDAEDEARALSSAPSGTLRMTTTVAFGQVCLLPLLREFRDSYPAIRLELQFTDANLDLLTEDVDLACRLTPGFDSGLIGVKLFDTHYHVCASPDYLETAPRVQSPADLGNHKCLVFDLPHYRSRWLFRNKKKRIIQVPIAADVSISSALALRQCAIQGMGPALLADWLVRNDLDNGSLVDLFPEFQVSATDFETAAWLLYPSRRYLPHKTRIMIDFLRDKVGFRPE